MGNHEHLIDGMSSAIKKGLYSSIAQIERFAPVSIEVQQAMKEAAQKHEIPSNISNEENLKEMVNTATRNAYLSASEAAVQVFLQEDDKTKETIRRLITYNRKINGVHLFNFLFRGGHAIYEKREEIERIFLLFWISMLTQKRKRRISYMPLPEYPTATEEIIIWAKNIIEKEETDRGLIIYDGNLSLQFYESSEEFGENEILFIFPENTAENKETIALEWRFENIVQSTGLGYLLDILRIHPPIAWHEPEG